VAFDLTARAFDSLRLPIHSEYRRYEPAGHRWFNLIMHICGRSGHVPRYVAGCRLEYVACSCGLKVY